MPALRLMPATGETLERILDDTYPVWGDGLTREAYARFNAAQLKTDWGSAHLQRLALLDGSRLLSSAKRYDFTGTLDGRRVKILGIAAVFTPAAERGRGQAKVLIEQMLADAAARGVDLALLFSEIGPRYYEQLGFRVVPVDDVMVEVERKPGAPAMLVRAGEERDYAEIAGMHAARAAGYRFSLDRPVDYVAYAIAKKRLFAGLSRAGHRGAQFFVAEEGGRAVAYLVMTVSRLRGRRGEHWGIEECGDRDPTGARLGAMLQVLLARAPGEQPPVIRTWLPTDFRPPQVSALTRVPSATIMMMRPVDPRHSPPDLKADDLIYWRGDAF
ncbi:MAG: GNAT family N-acetyltransferase [Acidobacteriota bacterium]|nr:GNAT family N-acetyltransferase [Acidobacteriota bacterium]